MLKIAKEMFEELGYKEKKDKSKTITYVLKNGYFYYIVFKINKKSVYKSKSVPGKEVSSSITIKELQAINQQCKELGWLEDK